MILLLNHDSSEGEQGSVVIIYPARWFVTTKVGYKMWLSSLTCLTLVVVYNHQT